jgi:hypothetical protein
MNEYTVGYYTPQGRMIITVHAESREEARTIALSQGYQVLDVSLD